MPRRPRPWDNDYVKRILAENEAGTKKFWTVDLPCGHGRIEVEKPEDQWITCRDCWRKFLLTWSPLSGHQKIASEQADIKRRFF